jgi:hypothetical protein
VTHDDLTGAVEQALTEAETPAICSIGHAAAVTGLSLTTLKRRIRSGELRALQAPRKGSSRRGGNIMILRSDLAAWLIAMGTAERGA